MRWNNIPGIKKDTRGNAIASDPGPLEREPKPGDVYEFTGIVYTPDHMYTTGDKLFLIEQTGHAPWGIISARGFNWIVKSEFILNHCHYHCFLNMKNEKCMRTFANKVSVWSGIEQMIAEKSIRLIDNKYEDRR